MPDIVPDVVVDPGELPPGALAQFGRSRFRSPEPIGALGVREDGAVFGHGLRYARLWDRDTGLVRWETRTTTHNLMAAAAYRADVIVTVENGRVQSRLTAFALGRPEPAHEQTLGSVRAVAVDALGKRALVIGDGIHVVDLASGETATPATRIAAIAGHVRNDGSVVVVEPDMLARWDGTEGGAVEPIAMLPSRARVVAFSADGDHVAWAAGDELTVLDTATGTPVMNAKRPGVVIETLALSADGNRVATGAKNRILVWEAGSTEPTWERRYANRPPVAFTPDGDVVSAEVTKLVRFSPDGQEVAAPSATLFMGFVADGSVRVDVGGRLTAIDPVGRREVPAGAAYEVAMPAGAPAWADRVAVALDGTMIAWSYDEATECGRVRVWRSSGQTWTSGKPRACDDAAGMYLPWELGPGVLIDVSKDAPVVWDAATGKRSLEIPAGGRTLREIVGLPDLDHVVAVFEDRDGSDDADDPRATGFVIEVWSRKAGRLVERATVPRARGRIRSMVAAREGGAVFMGWADGTLEVLSVPSAEVRTIGKHSSGVIKIEESPASRILAAMDEEFVTLIWAW